MALTFPASPTTGQTYSYNGETYEFDGKRWGKKSDIVAVSPVNADPYLTISGSGVGIADLPSDAPAGSIAYVTDNNGALFLKDGTDNWTTFTARKGTILNPAENALEIINAGHDVGDGIYWMKNANINSGNAFPVYCDMTKNGGGWMLVLNNRGDNVSYMGWTTSNIGLRNELDPRWDQAYSIIDWSDYLKRTDGPVWQWMIEANPTDMNTRYYGGGIFHSQQSHTMNTTALQSGVVADEWFPNPNGYYAFNTDQTIGGYCPHKGGYQYGTSSIFTTDDNDTSWWGCLVQSDVSYSSYHCGPWMSSGYGNIQSPDFVRVWIR